MKKFEKDLGQALEDEKLRKQLKKIKKDFDNKCKCKGGAKGRTVTADFEHQICEQCNKLN